MNEKRTLVIGDIHSGLRALRQILERAKVSQNDRLVFLGDYVDGWSEAVETVNFLIELSQTHDCILMRGNHDELCHDWLIEGKDNPLWLHHGGQATLDSYERINESIKKAHIQFYQQLRNYYLDEDNRLFLHAGFTNLKGVAHEYFEQTYYWDRTLWELARSLNPRLTPDDASYPKRLTHYKEVFIGHTPISKIATPRPQKAANVWNMDTGAAFKGSLSVMDVNTKQVWQSDPVHTLYPREKGRN